MNDDLKSKFVAFMEIRNQFMHNMNALTYVKCFENLPGKQKWILNTYPQPGVTLNAIPDIEEKLNDWSKKLIAEKKKINTTVLKGFGSTVRKAVFSSVAQHFKKIVAEERTLEKAERDAEIDAAVAAASISGKKVIGKQEVGKDAKGKKNNKQESPKDTKKK